MSASENVEDTGHEYDGIREHDNRLPRWWLITLWGAIVFAVAYWLAYHTFGVVPLPRAQFDEQMKVIAAKTPILDDAALAALSKDPAAVERGRAVYAQTCLACHGPDGQGVVGPNLTDDAWIHGDRPTEVYAAVNVGVLAFGMPAWGPSLGPDKTRDVTAFVLTLKGKNLPGKAPQGPRPPTPAPSTPSGG
jgi:cytochrome c oxidase cbb3-type subunit 3